MKKQIGLALGSGGGRGLAHIGVIKSLVGNNIPIDFITGSSIGAIVGGLYAAIGDIKELERIVDSLSFKSFLRSLFRKTPGKDSVFNKKFDSFFKNIVGEVNIEDLKIPYCAVGSSLTTGKIVVINKGSLITAMKASSAIPIILKPVKIDDDYVFDGGMITPVPTETVRQMGADIVIGVSLYGGIFPIKYNPNKNFSKIKAGAISRFISLERLTNNDMEKADIKIDLNIPGEDYGIFSKFLKNQGIINYGFESTEKMMVEIKKYKI